MKQRHSRLAFTLIELLVVIGILMMLAALVAPAVASAREAARNGVCKTRLHQLSLAAHQYEGVFGCLPRPQYFQNAYPGTHVLEPHQFSTPSIHLQILQYIDENLSEAVNWEISVKSDAYFSDESRAHLVTLARHRLSLFLCPSDSKAKQFVAGNSYRGALSVGPFFKQTPEFPDSGNGAFGNALFAPKLSQATDGLSRTAMFSERLVGSASPSYFDQSRDGTDLPGPSPRTAAALLVACTELANDPNSGRYFFAGKTWLTGGVHHTLYTHALPPNSNIPDCFYFGNGLPLGAGSARSSHPGSVNVAMMDGSVRSVTDSIDLALWRAIGTRDGVETVSMQ